MANLAMLQLLWQSMRPHQWLKNVFILTGLFFSRAFNQTAYVIPILLTIIAFTLVASSGYVFNDLMDKKVDIKHPQKHARPVASGKLSIYVAVCWMLSLLLAGLILGFWLSPNVFVLLLVYVLLTVLYSVKLKYIPWIEMLCIVMAFFLRILLGTFGVGIVTSSWLVFCGLLLASFLILAKRRSEQMLFERQNVYIREVLHHYKPLWLSRLVYLAAFLSFISYTFYAVLHHLDISIIWVALGLWRYLVLLQLRARQQVELDVASEFFQDGILQMIVVLWFGSVVFNLYLAN